MSNISPISEEKPGSTKPLVVLFPGVQVPQGITTYFLSSHATQSIDAFDETLKQMVAFIEQENPSKVIAIVPRRFRLDILAYLNGVIDQIEFVDPK